MSDGHDEPMATTNPQNGPRDSARPPESRAHPSTVVHGLARAYLLDQVVTAVILILITTITFAIVFSASDANARLSITNKLLFAVLTISAWAFLLLGAMISCFYWTQDRGSAILLSASRRALGIIAFAVLMSIIGLSLVLLSELIFIMGIQSSGSGMWWNYIALFFIVAGLGYTIFQNARLIKQIGYYYNMAAQAERGAIGQPGLETQDAYPQTEQV